MIEAIIALVVLMLVIGGVLWAGGGKTLYEAHGSGIVETVPNSLEQATLPAETLRVLSYNMEYGLRGLQDSTQRPDATAVYDRLDVIVAMIAGSGADIVLLQEVDFASRRTYDVDQLHYIAEALGWGFAARVIAWECRYLPYPLWPPGRWTGRLRAGSGVISRYPLMQNARQRLSQSAAHPLVSPLFAPYHMVQMVDVQCGERTVRLLNAHMQADHTVLRLQQAQEVVAFVRQVVTPSCVLMGTLQSTERTATDEAMSLMTTQLRDRLRPVGVPPLHASASMPAGQQPPALVGPGWGAVDTHILPCPEATFPHLPWLLHLQWALPLTVNGQQQDRQRLL